MAILKIGAVLIELPSDEAFELAKALAKGRFMEPDYSGATSVRPALSIPEIGVHLTAQIIEPPKRAPFIEEIGDGN